MNDLAHILIAIQGGFSTIIAGMILIMYFARVATGKALGWHILLVSTSYVMLSLRALGAMGGYIDADSPSVLGLTIVAFGFGDIGLLLLFGRLRPSVDTPKPPL